MNIRQAKKFYSYYFKIYGEECEDNIFKKVIDKFFNGEFDNSSLLLLKSND